MKERAFQAWVIEVAERFGWRVFHVPTPMRPIGGNRFVPEPRAAGLPDLLLLHDDPPRLIFSELKGDGGRLSNEQREFLRLARGVAEEARETGVSDYRSLGVYVWTPADRDTVEMILRSRVLP